MTNTIHPPHDVIGISCERQQDASQWLLQDVLGLFLFHFFVSGFHAVDEAGHRSAV